MKNPDDIAYRRELLAQIRRLAKEKRIVLMEPIGVNLNTSQLEKLLEEIRRRNPIKPPWIAAMVCLKCKKHFRAVIGPDTYQVKCPKCGSTDNKIEYWVD